MQQTRTFFIGCPCAVLCCIVLVLCCLVPATPASAQEPPPPITIDVMAGFDGHYRSNEWFPIVVLISNDGADVQGMLEWEFLFDNTDDVFRRQIDLPRGARKRIVFGAISNSFSRSGELRLMVDGREVLAQEVQLDPIGTEQFTVGILSSNETLLNSLLAMEINNQDGFVTVMHIDAETIPEDARLLGMLDALFIHDTDTATDLTEAQRDALELWVRIGGQLVLSGGGTAEQTSAGVAHLLPVTLNGLVSDASLDALAILARARRTDPPDTTTISAVTLKPGARALDTNNLLVEWPYGSGRVIFSAFDLEVLQGWQAEEELWAAVVQPIPTFDPAIQVRMGSDLIRNTLQLPELGLPSLGILILFIIIYILAVGPINFIVLKRMKRDELAWLTIPAIVAIFVIGTYGVGSVMRGQTSRVMQVDVVQAWEGETQAHATAFMGLFSPHRTFYTLTFAPDTLVSTTSFQMMNQNQAPLVWTDGATEVRDVLVDVSSLRTFIVEQRVDVDIALEGSVVHDGPQRNVEVRNSGSTPLNNAMFVYGSRSEWIGSLEPGERAQATMRSNNGAFPNNITIDNADEANPLNDENALFNRQQVLSTLFGFRFVPHTMGGGGGNTQGMPDEDGVYLLAWSDEPVVDLEVNRSVRHEGITLYVIRLDEE
jgi:hypothetical protein